MVGLCFTLVLLLPLDDINGLREDVLHKDLLRIRNNVPFDLSQVLAVDKVNDTDIIYYLYTRRRKKVIINKALHHVNRKHPVKILVHGWTEHYDVEWCNNTIDAYISKAPHNVISLDWSSKGDSDYVTASRYAKPIGDRIGDFVVELHEKRGVPYKNVHLVSHSLGAHVAGFVGKRVIELAGRKVGRITALDPAAPLFDLFTTGDLKRLSKDDADLVDVVHTDGGSLGFRFSIGTADFYPNGGTAIQPGCSLVKLDVKYEDLFCSHASSHQYFIKSIASKKLMAKPCGSWDKYARGLCDKNGSIRFGDGVPATASGNYYLYTNESDIEMF